MLDIKFIRENPEVVKDAIRKKRVNFDLDAFLLLDSERKKLLQGVEELRAKQRVFSEKVPYIENTEEKTAALESLKRLKKELNAREDEFKKKDEEWEKRMFEIPNIPDPAVPEGESDADNVEIKKWGEPKKFNFAPKDHLTLMKDLDIIDLERGVKVSGYRGYYLKNEGVLFHLGLMWHAIKKLKAKGFKLMMPPTLIRDFALIGSGHFPYGKDEIYQIANPGKLESGEAEKNPLYLAGTSEPSVLAYYVNERIDMKDLPIKIAGFSQCYRSEIGSYGKDTKGLYRVHEFMKVEQVIICRDNIEESNKHLEELLAISEEILQELELPYRVVKVCTGDMGAGKHKMYDIETWMPSRNNYGETHSDSNLTDWQARRLNIKYKDEEGKSRYVYTLNNTAIASPRILIALIENHQKEDGTIEIPGALKKFL